jgi:hypothetical protein
MFASTSTQKNSLACRQALPPVVPSSLPTFFVLVLNEMVLVLVIESPTHSITCTSTVLRTEHEHEHEKQRILLVDLEIV